MAIEHYDDVVIGSGQGGNPLALAFAAKGRRTALIENRNVGGTCINYGCTPTKTMIASARSAHAVAGARVYGVIGGDAVIRMDMKRVRARKRDIVSSFRDGSERQIEGTKNLTLIRGTASFAGARELTVDHGEGRSTEIAAERIFINTGTRPAVPSIEGLAVAGRPGVPYLDNESIMELAEVPEHLLVIGGGYIGVEFAQMFRRFGAKVTLVQRAARLLPREDSDVSEGLAELLRNEGIDLIFDGTSVSVAGEPADGARSGGAQRDRIRLTIDASGRERVIEGSHLLLAAGRTPNTDSLNLQAAGIAADEKGYIRVNERLEAQGDGAWALGDVKGGPAFTHIAYDDYRIILRNLYGDGKGTTVGRFVPYTVFTDPQLGRVGLGEEEARARGLHVRVAKMPMEWVARALEVDESFGFMKAVVDGTSGKILGFSMLGMEGGEIAGAVQLAMMGELTYADLRDATFAHPTLMEALNNLFASLP